MEDFQQAENLFRQLLEEDDAGPFTGEVYFHLGEMYFRREEFKRSKEMFETCLLHIPGHDRAAGFLKKLKRGENPPPCRLCGAEDVYYRQAYTRDFSHCRKCGFLFNFHYPKNLEKGMGFSAGQGGGYRELFLVRMMKEDFRFHKFLLFGTGNTPTFERLREQGEDVTGCDISAGLVEERQRKYGEASFCLPRHLPAGPVFDGIAAVEVFEHFTEPLENIRFLVERLSGKGIICGTTDLYPGGPLEDGNRYMASRGHVAYWSTHSLGYIAERLGLSVKTFEMVCPGSVIPDKAFGLLWPNKRVFFIYKRGRYDDYFDRLKTRTPILPIDKP